MAKRSALDVKIAEIDEQIATLHADIERWKVVRAFLVFGALPGPAPTEAKPKRTRGKAKARTIVPVAAKPDRAGITENEQ